MADPDDRLRGRARLASDVATLDLRGEKNTEASTPATAFDRPADRFETVGEIGRGGMGRVEDAFDRTLGRPVAIKHMLAMNAVDFARFEREARITARLEHPGIVPVHEAGRSSDGTPYYVMRRVDGQPLAQLVLDQSSFADRMKLIPNLLTACDAAGYAHARGIVHRDIKPSNILVGPFGETLLIDWGLARALDEAEQKEIASSPSDQNITRAGTVAGTPGFMAPEQARGESVDARADVFALGATLFFVLSGQLPWGSTSATELVDIVSTGREPDWKRLPREVPPDLRAVLEKAMAVDPAARYPDAGALAADLRRFTLGNLVAAYEYGPVAKLVRYARKHRAAFGVGFIALAVIAIVAVISIRRVVAERDDAREARTLAERRQREATDLADGLLVQHARELAESDPAAAIAALRRLRPESTRWGEAWAAASIAWLRGVPVGFVGTPGPASMRISPDGHLLFTLSSLTGDLMILDLGARTRRQVVRDIGAASSAQWLTSRYVVCDLWKKGLGVIDVQTGAVSVVPIDVKQIFSTHDRIWVHSTTGDVLELTDPARAPKTVLTNVEDLYAAPDLKSALLVRAKSSELWLDGKALPLPLKEKPMAAAVRNGVIAVMDSSALHGYRVAGDKLVELGHWPRGDGYAVAVLYEVPVLLTVGGVWSHTTKGGVFQLERGSINYGIDNARGFIASTSDGRILIHDRDGRFEIGKRPMAFRQVDLSLDGRWAAALATSGEVLVWDLGQLRPHRIPIGKSEQAMAIGDDWVWLRDPSLGVRKLNLATGESVTLIRSPYSNWDFIGYGGKYVATVIEQDKEIWIHDAMLNRVRRFTGVAKVANDGSSIAMAGADGKILIWKPGDDKPHQITKLAKVPDFIAVSGQFVLARVGERDLSWIDTATNTVVPIAMPETVRAVGLLVSGRAWMIAGGKAYQWTLGSIPIEVPTPGPVDDLLPLSDGIILHCASSIVIVHDGSSRVVPLVSQEMWGSPSDDVLLFVTPQLDVGLLDLDSESTVTFPARKPLESRVTADNTRVAYRDTRVKDTATLLVWTIRVPRDPLAFRAWLATVTNAKPVENSDSVAYP